MSAGQELQVNTNLNLEPIVEIETNFEATFENNADLEIEVEPPSNLYIEEGASEIQYEVELNIGNNVEEVIVGGEHGGTLGRSKKGEFTTKCCLITSKYF